MEDDESDTENNENSSESLDLNFDIYPRLRRGGVLRDNSTISTNSFSNRSNNSSSGSSSSSNNSNNEADENQQQPLTARVVVSPNIQIEIQPPSDNESTNENDDNIQRRVREQLNQLRASLINTDEILDLWAGTTLFFQRPRRTPSDRPYR